MPYTHPDLEGALAEDGPDEMPHICHLCLLGGTSDADAVCPAGGICGGKTEHPLYRKPADALFMPDCATDMMAMQTAGR